MSTVFGSDPLEELAIPDGTHIKEHDLVTDGDVLVGGQSDVELGVRGASVVAGERVTFGGDIEADGDCRLDMWCDVDGNVLVGQDAYLGERVHITGQLIVSGDLDIGDDVDIERGFEANGWIVIRNPMPTIVFLFVYLSQLLRIGEEEAAEDIMSELLDDDHEHDPVMIPRSSSVSDDAWRVSTPASVGADCRLHGNVRAESITVGVDTEIFGSLRAREDIAISAETTIHGDVTTRNGTVRIAANTTVRGDVSADDVVLHDAAVVEGAIRARGQMTMLQDDSPLVGTDADDESSAETDSGTDGTEIDDADEDVAEETDEAADLDEDAASTEADASTATDERDAVESAADETGADETDDETTDIDEESETDERTDTDEESETDERTDTSDDEPVPAVTATSDAGDPVTEGAERVTAADGDSRAKHRENGHEEPTE